MQAVYTVTGGASSQSRAMERLRLAGLGKKNRTDRQTSNKCLSFCLQCVIVDENIKLLNTIHCSQKTVKKKTDFCDNYQF